ncbi:DUF5719 family protein [Cellulomonas sp. ATA003]|nr:DUF5719 family protein [Cellulomonas sp. ATA003]WNB86340.1 DUF5719 family protein [Cellulomonas sp. ATA003]
MRRRTARVTRLVTGVAVVVAAAGVAVAGSVPAGPPRVEATASVVQVPPTATTLVCPGPLVQPDGGASGDAAFDPTPVDTLTTQRVVTTAPPGAAVAAPVTLSPLGGGPALLDLSASGSPAARVGGVAGVDGPTLLRAEPAGPVAAPAGGASASVTTEGDLRGLAAASCQLPTASSWLVGGSTEVGSSALLVVVNPGRTPPRCPCGCGARAARWRPSAAARSSSHRAPSARCSSRASRRSSVASRCT